MNRLILICLRSFLHLESIRLKLEGLFLRRNRSALQGVPIIDRNDNARCLACQSSHLIAVGSIPYYRVQLEKWASKPATFLRVAGEFRGASTSLTACRSCGFQFVESTYDNLVSRVEKSKLTKSESVAPYIDSTQPSISPSIVSKILQSPVESLSPVERNFRTYYHILQKYLAERSRFLDLGCNMGAFAEFVRLAFAGSEVSGCEIDEAYVETLRKRYPAIRVFNRVLTSESSFEFDCIFLCDVIEHIWDLDSFVSAIRANLAPHGCVMVVTPNVQSPGAIRNGLKWWGYLLPHHCQLFSARSLHLLFERHGFQKLEDGYLDDEMWVVFQLT